MSRRLSPGRRRSYARYAIRLYERRDEETPCCALSISAAYAPSLVACPLSESRAARRYCVRPIGVTCALSKLIEDFVQKTPPEKPEMDESRPQLSFGARNLKTEHATRAGRTQLSVRACTKRTHGSITSSALLAGQALRPQFFRPSFQTQFYNPNSSAM